MNPIKQALEASDEYAKQSTWMDFALIKICLCALGVMIGLSIPKDKRKPVLAGAAVAYAATYLSIMVKFIPMLKDHMTKD
jgi:uncharacterized protein involved in response to NO